MDLFTGLEFNQTKINNIIINYLETSYKNNKININIKKFLIKQNTLNHIISGPTSYFYSTLLIINDNCINFVNYLINNWSKYFKISFFNYNKNIDKIYDKFIKLYKFNNIKLFKKILFKYHKSYDINSIITLIKKNDILDKFDNIPKLPKTSELKISNKPNTKLVKLSHEPNKLYNEPNNKHHPNTQKLTQPQLILSKTYESVKFSDIIIRKLNFSEQLNISPIDDLIKNILEKKDEHKSDNILITYYSNIATKIIDDEYINNDLFKYLKTFSNNLEYNNVNFQIIYINQDEEDIDPIATLIENQKIFLAIIKNYNYFLKENITKFINIEIIIKYITKLMNNNLVTHDLLKNLTTKLNTLLQVNIDLAKLYNDEIEIFASRYIILELENYRLMKPDNTERNNLLNSDIPNIEKSKKKSEVNSDTLAKQDLDKIASDVAKFNENAKEIDLIINSISNEHISLLNFYIENIYEIIIILTIIIILNNIPTKDEIKTLPVNQEELIDYFLSQYTESYLANEKYAEKKIPLKIAKEPEDEFIFLTKKFKENENIDIIEKMCKKFIAFYTLFLENFRYNLYYILNYEEQDNSNKVLVPIISSKPTKEPDLINPILIDKTKMTKEKIIKLENKKKLLQIYFSNTTQEDKFRSDTEEDIKERKKIKTDYIATKSEKDIQIKNTLDKARANIAAKKGAIIDGDNTKQKYEKYKQKYFKIKNILKL